MPTYGVHARLGVIGAFNGNSTDALLVGMLCSGILARIEAIVETNKTIKREKEKEREMRDMTVDA